MLEIKKHFSIGFKSFFSKYLFIFFYPLLKQSIRVKIARFNQKLTMPKLRMVEFFV